MNNLVLIVNTLTNAFAIPGICSLLYMRDNLGASILFISMCASCMMHITESKHHLKPLILARHSKKINLFDQVLSYVITCYIGYTYRQRLYDRPWVVGRFILGGMALRIGERTNDLPSYLFLHTIWHYLSYGSIPLIFD